ncbi:integrase [Prosthecomicrobium hirschii]|uniref:Integrase n=1 Tax=Prosthecodimorpha hirschii TaxID=665126 RepID=A0A0N8GFW9_9HYPH|nr:tyrosine-type recombinase/integrase [Prosthecomicrobium hirschii]KPL55489.1 integrase [Prosthecomicrobium hirschii]
MVRVNLQGINCRRKKLATGETVEYWYAWKGGPRLRGQPGSPEFVASYAEAHASRKKPQAGVMHSLLRQYQDSADFAKLAPRTRSDYIGQIKAIEKKFGDFPLSALVDKRTRGIFMQWRDKQAATSLRQADYAWTVLARVLSWALDRRLIDANPCARGGRLYRGNRAENIWTDDDETAFLKSAPSHLHLPLMLALWTGQRQGDLLRLTWTAYDGERIKLKQSKTGARVNIPVGAPLKVMLDATPRLSTQVLVNSDGRPWTEGGFRASFRKAQAAAGITDLTFNDLRGTAVTRLALAEATEAQIATITGHSLRDVRSILDAHYLHRDPALATAGIRKLERRTKTPDRAPD